MNKPKFKIGDKVKFRFPFTGTYPKYKQSAWYIGEITDLYENNLARVDGTENAPLWIPFEWLILDTVEYMKKNGNSI